MAHYITPSLIILATTLMTFSSSSFALKKTLPASTISAAPAILPDPMAPLSSSPSPALSPDITPLFPSPGGSEFAPTESAPLIPSSPSPPNPDGTEALGPASAFSPSEVLPDSSSDGLSVAVFLNAMVVLFAAIWVNHDMC